MFVWAVFVHRAEDPGHDAESQWSPKPKSLHAPASTRSSAGHHTHCSHAHHKLQPVTPGQCHFHGRQQHWAEVTSECWTRALTHKILWPYLLSVIKLIFKSTSTEFHLCSAGKAFMAALFNRCCLLIRERQWWFSLSVRICLGVNILNISFRLSKCHWIYLKWISFFHSWNCNFFPLRIKIKRPPTTFRAVVLNLFGVLNPLHIFLKSWGPSPPPPYIVVFCSWSCFSFPLVSLFDRCPRQMVISAISPCC